MQYKFIDLFAGIGGMRLAYEAVGCKCVYSNEWNKYSQQTYEANFGEKPEGDITKVDASTIPDHDILVAGFPCQPFSIAGVSKKNSLGRATGFEDKTQGTLFFDVCRICKHRNPEAKQIIGLAFSNDRTRDSSEDMMLLNVSAWTEEDDQVVELMLQSGIRNNFGQRALNTSSSEYSDEIQMQWSEFPWKD